MAPNPLLPPNRPFRFSKPAFPGRLRGFRTFVGGVFVGAPVFTWGVPYFAPFWSPYDYWDSYGYGTAPALPDYAPPPQYGPSYTPPPSTAPPSSSTPPEQPKQLSMLAFKDHTVAEVEDYWLQGDQVFYLTPEGVQHFVSIDQLDLPATERLNRQRNLPFVLESRP